MTPLFKKLNFKNQKVIHLINHPDSFNSEIELMKNFSTFEFDTNDKTVIEFIVSFVKTIEEINTVATNILPQCNYESIIWFCYPKGTSNKYTCEFNRDNGWQLLGDLGYEGVRQVAIDEDWSALRFKKVEKIKTLIRNFAMSEVGKKRTAKD
jgi:hypothetical protein